MSGRIHVIESADKTACGLCPFVEVPRGKFMLTRDEDPFEVFALDHEWTARALCAECYPQHSGVVRSIQMVEET